jgi:hypothetical protein
MVSAESEHFLTIFADLNSEWKGRDDGLVAHVFFRSGPNFALSVFAFAVEGEVATDQIHQKY